MRSLSILKEKNRFKKWDAGLNSTDAGKVEAIRLSIEVGAAESEVDVPGVRSMVGNRRRRPCDQGTHTPFDTSNLSELASDSSSLR